MKSLIIVCVFLAVSVALGEKCEDTAGTAHCLDRKPLCQTEGFRQHYRNICHKTCGWCTARDEDEKCEDTESAAHCLDRKPLCHTKGFEDYLKRVCHKTCGWCTARDEDEEKTFDDEKCEDTLGTAECENRKGLCGPEFKGFHEYYKKVCRKTCGHCTARDENEEEMVDDAVCKDTDTAYCQKRKDRCKLGWMKAMMKRKCPKTCGYCGTDTTLPPGVTNPPYTGKCGVPEVKGVRVVSGTTPPRGAWPWQVLFLWDDKSPFCGGTLIAPQWVVSAAHCVYGDVEDEPTRLYVRVGGHDWRHIMGSEKDIKVAKIIRHDQYDSLSMNNDITLIKLSKPVMFNKYVQPACLPTGNVPVGSKCYITGFGHTSAKSKMNPVIQQGLLPVVSNEVCYEKNKHIMKRPVRDGNICGGSGGTSPISGCQGDSGGPYVCHVNGRWELHGAVSYGSPFCKSSDMYTVFARIYYYLDWLKHKMAKH